MDRREQAAAAALVFEDAVIALGSSPGFPEQPETWSSPSVRSVLESGSASLWVEGSAVEALEAPLLDASGRALADLSGVWIDDAVLMDHLERDPSGGHRASDWIRVLEEKTNDPGGAGWAPILHAIHAARVGHRIIDRFDGRATWASSLPMHLSALADCNRAIACARRLHAMLPGCSISMPFAPDLASWLPAARALANERISFAATNVFSVDQAMIAAGIAGADFIEIGVGAIDELAGEAGRGLRVAAQAEACLRHLGDQSTLVSRVRATDLRVSTVVVDALQACSIAVASPRALVELIAQEPDDLESRSIDRTIRPAEDIVADDHAAPHELETVDRGLAEFVVDLHSASGGLSAETVVHDGEKAAESIVERLEQAGLARMLDPRVRPSEEARVAFDTRLAESALQDRIARQRRVDEQLAG